MNHAMKQNDAVRKAICLPTALAQEVDDFRFGNRYHTDADALRVLIEAGLKAMKEKSASGSDPR